MSRTVTLRNGSVASSRITWVLCTVMPFSAASAFARSWSAAAPSVPLPPGRSRCLACSRRFCRSSRSAVIAPAAATKRAARASCSWPASISSATARR